MNIREIGNCLRIATPAKLNLFLEILERRDDGFHELETIMTKLSVHDVLDFTLATDEQTCLNVISSPPIEHGNVPEDESNLIIKALQLVRDLAGQTQGITIRLFKNIPVQAGLGGASGNAAGAIVAANRIWKLNWPLERLLEIAGQIGSDVAFFLANSLAQCTGRGERVHNLNYPRCLNVVIAKPNCGMSTAEIYSRCIVPSEPISSKSILSGLHQGPVSRIGKSLFNRLEEFAAVGHPEVARMRTEFGKTNSVGHQLTGSGSCYFGIYHNRRSMLSAAKILATRLPDMHVFTGQTLSSRNHCLQI